MTVFIVVEGLGSYPMAETYMMGRYSVRIPITDMEYNTTYNYHFSDSDGGQDRSPELVGEFTTPTSPISVDDDQDDTGDEGEESEGIPIGSIIGMIIISILLVLVIVILLICALRMKGGNGEIDQDDDDTEDWDDDEKEESWGDDEQ